MISILVIKLNVLYKFKKKAKMFSMTTFKINTNNKWKIFKKTYFLTIIVDEANSVPLKFERRFLSFLYLFVSFLCMNMFTVYPIILINILFESISYFLFLKVVVGRKITILTNILMKLISTNKLRDKIYRLIRSNLMKNVHELNFF